MYKFCVGSQNNTIETWMKTGVFFYSRRTVQNLIVYLHITEYAVN